MKRSEALEQVELFIDECLNRDNFTICETADCLLDFLEGMGMRPHWYVTSDGNAIWNWEPENEA